MDPLSIAAALLAITTATIASTRSLCETVKRLRGRDKLLRRLEDELEDLTTILDSLRKVTDAEQSMLALLQGLVERCGQVCREFQSSMETFNGKTKTGIRDWAKMEFMRGDINEFIETVSGYKSTISVGLGIITLHNSKVSRHALQSYTEMIHDTAHNLGIHLQRIEERLAQLQTEQNESPQLSIDLDDEKEVTRQCLRVCEDARSQLQSLSDKSSSLLPEVIETSDQPQTYEAQMRTRQALDGSQEAFAQVIVSLSTRLQSLVQRNAPENDAERRRLQSDMDISKQGLSLCSVASNISRQKVYKIGEAIADGDSDQVVVNTLADMFDVGKVLSRDNSMQLISATTEDTFCHVVEQRYRSRFGAVTNGSAVADAKEPATRSAVDPQDGGVGVQARVGDEQESRAAPRRHRKPSSNEQRKRKPDGVMDE